MEKERELAIDPLVPDCMMHNNKVLANIRAVTGFLFGIAAGILGLQSYAGFVFYLVGSTLVSACVVTILAKGKPATYWQSNFEVWYAEVFGGLSGFILTWTLFFGLIRA